MRRSWVLLPPPQLEESVSEPLTLAAAGEVQGKQPSAPLRACDCMCSLPPVPTLLLEWGGEEGKWWWWGRSCHFPEHSRLGLFLPGS